jgi:hypothetical protein
MDQRTGHCFSKKLIGCAVITLALLFPLSLQAANKTDFEKGGLEYHFLLNNITNINEQYMPVMPVQVAEKLAPMFIVDPRGKMKNGIYIDTPDRKLKQKNLILLVKNGKLTVKSRGNSPEEIADLPKCERKKSSKKYEVDYFGTTGYSISSSIRFSPEELDIANNMISPAKVGAFLEKACAPLYEKVKDVLADPSVVIPGTSNQYKFKVKLGKGYPLADNKDLEVDLAIWYFPTTSETVFEISFTGPAAERTKLEELQKQTFAFLEKRAMVSPKQNSKTQTFFDVLMPQK